MKIVNVKRLSLILALALLISSVPLAIFAEDAATATQSETDILNEIK